MARRILGEEFSIGFGDLGFERGDVVVLFVVEFEVDLRAHDTINDVEAILKGEKPQ